MPAEVADDLLAPGAPCDTKQDGSEWLEGGARLVQQRELGSTKKGGQLSCVGPGLVSVELHRIGQGRSPCGHCRILSSRSHSMEAEEKNRTHPAMGQSDNTHGAASLHSSTKQT